MATAVKKKIRDGEFEGYTVQQSICSRCGGLMVNDSCLDVLSNTGELEFAAKRCVQCGEVVDPVIQRNRQLRQALRKGLSVKPPQATDLQAQSSQMS